MDRSKFMKRTLWSTKTKWSESLFKRRSLWSYCFAEKFCFDIVHLEYLLNKAGEESTHKDAKLEEVTDREQVFMFHVNVN